MISTLNTLHLILLTSSCKRVLKAQPYNKCKTNSVFQNTAISVIYNNLQKSGKPSKFKKNSGERLSKPE